MNYLTVKKKIGPRKESSKYQAVLVATRELVEAEGYRKLTVKSISSKANVSRNLIYNWWDGDIQKIIEEALLPNVAEWKTPSTGALTTDLQKFIDMSTDALHQPHVLAGYLELASSVVDNPEALQKTNIMFRKPYAKMLKAILENAKQRGELSDFDATGAIDHTSLAQIISGCILQFAITKKPGKRKAKKLVLESVLKLLK
ncbi:MAG: TetR/AcrR family transcriptional regulator [Gammaproteobacteria bacterium]|nr:TetR/AcrR family transcriptional regulator [Gammaproteobacteria bacterium]